tara:strand:+ start:291 stop:1823 length:1533 start_codon:yes stop_codon:yes gene_type:complete
MVNNFFFENSNDEALISRLREIEKAKVGFYSVGLYAASLAYNCAMQTDGSNLLLAARPSRELLGAYSKDKLAEMDSEHLKTIFHMGTHIEGGRLVNNSLSDLILRCDLVILSSNSKYIESDLIKALKLRETLKRESVVLACLSGSFSLDDDTNNAYVLCEKEPNLAFFSGFHRHDALRNPLDSFTANFCHPNVITAILGARMLDRISPNIQVSAGVHNIEGQYIKSVKNIASIFAGFGHSFHKDNAGLLPTLLTLLMNQCMDQAATVSASRKDRNNIYDLQALPLTELGYGVQRIEASLMKFGDLEKVRDHTFSQLTAMVADVRGSMMLPVTGEPTRNFKAGQVLAERMKSLKRCPKDLDEFINWCESSGLSIGGLEGLNALKCWPLILKRYQIPLHDSSMINLIYMCIFAPHELKNIFYDVLTESRQLTNYCQESVRPNHSRRFSEALDNNHLPNAISLILNCIKSDFSKSCTLDNFEMSEIYSNDSQKPYIRAMNIIENYFEDYTNGA